MPTKPMTPKFLTALIRDSLAAGGKGELAAADLESLFLRLSFGEAKAGDLWLAVDAGGDQAVVNRLDFPVS